MAFEGTKSREAHIYRAKGLEWRLRNTNASNRKARAFFEQAIACDPGYALAYSDLAARLLPAPRPGLDQLGFPIRSTAHSAPPTRPWRSIPR